MTTPDQHDGLDSLAGASFAGLPRRQAVDPSRAAEAYGEAVEGRPGGPDDADGVGAQAPEDEEHDSLPLGHEATVDELAQRLEQAEAAVTILEAERDEYRDDLQRKAAELSNVLKREERNAQAGRVEGRIDVVRALLDVLDDFDRTMDAVAKTEDDALRSGVQLVHDKFAAALRGLGLERVGEVGEPFDPGTKHDAVHQIEAEDGPLDEPIVAEVYRPGYLLGERVVRPAMVVVKQ